MLWKWLARVLRRWADAAHVQTERLLREEISERDRKITALESQAGWDRDLIKKQAADLELCYQQIMARAKAETARGEISEALNQSSERD